MRERYSGDFSREIRANELYLIFIKEEGFTGLW